MELPPYVADTASDQNNTPEFPKAASSRQPLTRTNTPLNLQIRFFPDPRASSNRDRDWEADLSVHSTDIVGLMKDGFHWSEANVQHEGGFFVIDEPCIPQRYRERGLNCVRGIRLAHKPEHGEAQWIASLWIYARKVSVLARFRVHELSTDKIHTATAWNLDDRCIYSYHVLYPENNFNAILDDQPLEGWWPWPKKEQACAAGGKARKWQDALRRV